MEIKEYVRLSELTTLKTGGNARFFCEVSDELQLKDALGFAKEKKISFFILGNGSNVLISDDGFAGLVIKISVKGIRIESDGKDFSMISAGAGETFDDLITFSLKHNLFGIENLWNIPGSVGAAAVQNIGAYGVEAKDCITAVSGINSLSGENFLMQNADCHFAYRSSIFKKDKSLVIARVLFKLNKIFFPHLTYPALREVFGEGKNITATDMQKTIGNIRSSKLPDWKKLATAGSFFKNPTITEKKYTELKALYPDLPSFPSADRLVKIPLGYVIDKICLLKGFRIGDARIYEKQALVIVNFGKAKAFEINNLAKDIEKKVFEKIGLKIEREVEQIGF